MSASRQRGASVYVQAEVKEFSSSWKWLVPALAFVFACCVAGNAQQSGASSAQPPTPQQTSQPAPDTSTPRGEVLFQSGDSVQGKSPQPSVAPAAAAPDQTRADTADAERSALSITAYDLDARITPAASRLAMRAQLSVRNGGTTPLAHIALQVSSQLTWESTTLVAGGTRTRLPLAQHMLDTDADRTGKASEAVLTLPAPLVPGAELRLDAFYSGALTPSSERLQRIGASAAVAAQADWDAIGEQATALRGFGNVLWYPASSPQVFLGEGAQLFDAVGRMKLRNQPASVRLRVAVEYAGAPPVAAYFCGRRVALKAVSENAEMAAATAPGLAVAEFPAQPLGFRSFSLFIVPLRETPADPQPGGWSLLSVETEDEAPLAIVAASAQDAAGLLTDWLGPQPLSALTVLDHPGQPFEDGPLLVAPLASLAGAEAVPAVVHSLTHAWLQTGQPWMDEGLAEFFVLLWTERTRGLDAALDQMRALEQPLALGEVAPEQGKAASEGQPIVAASSEVYYRRKAAAVWWMLRDVAGEQPLRLALSAWRTQPASGKSAAEEAVAFERLLEKTSGRDLGWFFDDWVLHDRGLPDLTVTDVTPRELPTSAGKTSGWLTSVTVKNEGAAAAEVPVVVRSGSFSERQRLRVPGFGSATARILAEAPPTEVVVNDGSVPEQRTSLHQRAIKVTSR